jgi:hypothetical protein
MTDDVRVLFERKRAENAADLEAAEKEALESGKQRFDVAQFERMLKRGPQNEAERRMGYYVMHPEFQTMGEYATFLQGIEPWEDSK